MDKNPTGSEDYLFLRIQKERASLGNHNLRQTIDNPIDPEHLLFLRVGERFDCYSCRKSFQNRPYYACETCEIYLDLDCALRSDFDPKGQDYFQSFTHPHPMILISEEDSRLHDCFACHVPSSDPLYGCIHCKYFLHKSCADRCPKNILHAFHPQHSLILFIDLKRNCHHCRDNCHPFKYRCKGSDRWLLGAKCAMTSFMECEVRYQQKACWVCGKVHLDPVDFFCAASKFQLNKSCIVLPQEIETPFHPHKLLYRKIITPGFSCASCHKQFVNCEAYKSELRCDDSEFIMDIRCALMPNIQCEGGDQIQHFTHQHLLTLIKEIKTVNFDADCFACRESCSVPLYGCINCDSFLHKSCAEALEQTEHPFHSSHPFTTQLHRYLKMCISCSIQHTGYLFWCKICHFYICIKCFPLRGTHLKYQGHPHNLHTIKVTDSKFTCNASYCFSKYSMDSWEFNLPELHTVRCVHCTDFKIHLLCGPLPCKIDSKRHVHPLFLLDSMVEDEADEFYCDICEEERDARLGVYYCTECEFIAHVHCLASEIVSGLRGEIGDIELRSIGEREVIRLYELIRANTLPKKLEYPQEYRTLKDLLRSLTAEETENIMSLFSPRLEELFEDKPGDTTPNDLEFSGPYIPPSYMELRDRQRRQSKYDRLQNQFRYHISSEEDSDPYQPFRPLVRDDIPKYIQQIKDGRPEKWFHISSEECKMKVVKVGDYWILSSLASVLQDLLGKYGDISVNYVPSGRKERMIWWFFACRMIQSMRRIVVADVSRNVLTEWSYYSKTFNKVTKLDDLYEAHFGLHVLKQRKQNPTKLDREIAELEAKLAELRRIREQYAVLENTRELKQMQETSKNAAARKWKTTAEVVLT